MTLPILHKTWTHQTNNRISYVSLNSTLSKLLFGIKAFLVGTMGCTVKYSCDGTTGPSSGSDHTDRWLSSANCTTRGANAASAQSFCVITDGNGVDILLTYQGTTDDTMKMSMSVGALFTPAGTANQQPTATDETIILPANSSAIGGATGTDRLWHIMMTTDKKMFRVFVYQASSMAYSFGIDVVTPAVTAFTWPITIVGWASNISNPNSLVGGHLLNLASTAGNAGVARIGTTNLIASGGGEMFGGINANIFGENNVPLEGGAPITSVGFYSTTTSFQGKLGDRFDVYFVWSNAIAQADTMGSNAWVYFGTGLWPWNGGPVVIS